MNDIKEMTLALEAIQKKLVGKKLTYKEIFAVMDEIAHKRLGVILSTYFAASGYSKGFTNDEIYSLTRAMIETGEQLKFDGIVADKHSIGGVPGTRTTMIVTPLVAAAGFTIPKSSSRAITTPGGTADDMEVLCPVTYGKAKIYEFVEKTGACLVWGGGVDIAPADDELIKVEKPLALESFDKVLVSIMAKKIAFGSNHIVIDIPYGAHVKVHKKEDAVALGRKFEYLAKRFNVKLAPYVHNMTEPAGRGIGPLLEAREAIRVLEQKPDRPLDLEIKALTLAGMLLELCLPDAHKDLREKVKKEYGSGYKWAQHILASGQAHAKMKEIIAVQGGNPNIKSEQLKPGHYNVDIMADKNAVIKSVNSKNASTIAKILGAPTQKKAGIYIYKKIGERAVKGQPLYTIYSEHPYTLKEARDSLIHFPIIEYA